MEATSRLPGFHRLPLVSRRAELATRTHDDEMLERTLDEGGLTPADADKLVENAVGIFALPLGLGLNFAINGRDYLIPMAVEEPSVVAAASNAARIARMGGGFIADADPSIMTAQIEVLGVPRPESAVADLQRARCELLAIADEAVPRLVQRGGGARDLSIRALRGDEGVDETRLVVHLHVDCRDAMGANLVNTIAEAVAPRIGQIAGGRHGLRILSNLCDRRLVRAAARIPVEALAVPGGEGAEVARQIVAASRFAELDPYRAATHNKGIMNGVDAVVIATGNDWRGVEAGAHAFAARSGQYRPLATWRLAAGDLAGRLEMPMAVGTVGRATELHRGAGLAQRILGVRTAGELATVIACVGLASNLAALRALVTHGIQRGHMALHKRALAQEAAVGGAGDLSPSRVAGDSL